MNEDDCKMLYEINLTMFPVKPEKPFRSDNLYTDSTVIFVASGLRQGAEYLVLML